MYKISSKKLQTFNEKHGLTVVNSVQRLGMTPAQNKEYDVLTERIFESPSLAISRAKEVVERNPGIPEYLLALVGAYLVNGDVGSARKLEDQLIRDYPDYAMGTVAGILNSNDEARIMELGSKLGPNLSMMDWPHNVKGGHGIYSYIQFEQAAAKYLTHKKQLEAASDRIERLLELGVDEGELYRFIDAIIIQEMKQNLNHFSENKAQTVQVEERHTASRPQRKRPTPLQLPEMENLRAEFIEVLTEAQIDALLELPREQLIADLRTAMMDFVDLASLLDGDEDALPFEPVSFAHFWQLLVLHEQVDALPLMLDALRLTKDHFEYYTGDFGAEICIPGLTLLGRERLDLLEDYLLEPHNSAYSRTYVGEALTQMGLHFPEQREDVAERLQRVLRHHLEHQDDEGIFDTTFISFLIINLLDLRYPAALPLIEECFQQDIVDFFITDEPEVIRMEINTPTDTAPHYYLPDNRYAYFEIKGTYIPDPTPQIEKIGDVVAKKETATGRNPLVTALKEERRFELLTRAFGTFGEDDDYVDDDFEPFAPTRKLGTVVRTEKKVGRNDPCPCGSGKKYKKCCL